MLRQHARGVCGIPFFHVQKFYLLNITEMEPFTWYDVPPFVMNSIEALLPARMFFLVLSKYYRQHYRAFIKPVYACGID
jgi:hypothetical protein